MDGEKIIFLISQPRAGSTFLQRLLQNHPEIHSAPEPWIMLHPLYGLKDSGFEAEYNAWWAQTATQKFYQSLSKRKDFYFEGVRRMYEPIYETALQDSGKAFFLDKTPRYYHIIPELLRTFPKAKFIILLRNPISVFGSILTTWVKDDLHKVRNFESDLFKAPDCLLSGVEILRKNSCSVSSICYEKILDDPEKHLRKLCHSIGISFSSRMLIPRNSPQLGYGYKDQTVDSLNTVIMRSHPEQWLGKFKNPQHWRLAQDYLLSINERTFTGLGYSLSETKEALEAIKPNKLALYRTKPLESLLDKNSSYKGIKNSYARLGLTFLAKKMGFC